MGRAIEGECSGRVHFSNGDAVSCKHLFLGLNVMGESTVKRDCLEGVLSAEVRRWEKPLEKDLLGSIHSLREGNGRAPVKKGVSSYPVFRMDLRDSSP